MSLSHLNDLAQLHADADAADVVVGAVAATIHQLVDDIDDVRSTTVDIGDKFKQNFTYHTNYKVMIIDENDVGTCMGSTDLYGKLLKILKVDYIAR